MSIDSSRFFWSVSTFKSQLKPKQTKIHKTATFGCHIYVISNHFHRIFSVYIDLDNTTHIFSMKHRHFRSLQEVESKRRTKLLSGLSNKTRIMRNFPEKNLPISWPKPKRKFKDIKKLKCNRIHNSTNSHL